MENTQTVNIEDMIRQELGWTQLDNTFEYEGDALKFMKFLHSKYGNYPTVKHHDDGYCAVSWAATAEMVKDYEDWCEFGPFPCDSTDMR